MRHGGVWLSRVVVVVRAVLVLVLVVVVVRAVLVLVLVVVVVVVVRVAGAFVAVCVGHHHGVGGRHTTPQHIVERERVAVDVQAAEDVGHPHLVGPGMHQRAHGHIARSAGEAVEPGGAGHGIILAIADAAPKPLSMPTTVTPLAHEACMASSAVTPSRPAP